MNLPYHFDPAALKEYKDAVVWYNERSLQAAENFIREINTSIRLICRNPLRYRNAYKEFRETSIKKFPYSIVYYYDQTESRIIIFSIYHHKRNPKRKYIINR